MLKYIIFTGKTGTNILQKAFVPILSDEKCLFWHKHKKIKVDLHEEMFCAGHSDGHMDACLVRTFFHAIYKPLDRPTCYESTFCFYIF